MFAKNYVQLERLLKIMNHWEFLIARHPCYRLHMIDLYAVLVQVIKDML